MSMLETNLLKVKTTNLSTYIRESKHINIELLQELNKALKKVVLKNKPHIIASKIVQKDNCY